MDVSRKYDITPYQDVNDVLHTLMQDIVCTIDDNLVGLYLTGSLSYGGFRRESSDIDLVAIVRSPLSPKDIEAVREMHLRTDHGIWTKRIECSYTPLTMLSNILPPQELRPYFNDIFYPDAIYGNEWIINLYLLYHHAITLIGPDFKTLIALVDIVEVQKACIRDLFREWEPKLDDMDWMSNSHYQSYLVLNLCRILYTVLRGMTGSKPVSTAWIKHEYPEWTALIEAAQNWQYGIEMNRAADTGAFIRFVINEVSGTALYEQVFRGNAISK